MKNNIRLFDIKKKNTYVLLSYKERQENDKHEIRNMNKRKNVTKGEFSRNFLHSDNIIL
jgi:hypothetical protein